MKGAMSRERETREEQLDYESFPTIKGTGPKKLPPISDTPEPPRRRPKPSQDNTEAEEES